MEILLEFKFGPLSHQLYVCCNVTCSMLMIHTDKAETKRQSACLEYWGDGSPMTKLSGSHRGARTGRTENGCLQTHHVLSRGFYQEREVQLCSGWRAQTLSPFPFPGRSYFFPLLCHHQPPSLLLLCFFSASFCRGHQMSWYCSLDASLLSVSRNFTFAVPLNPNYRARWCQAQKMCGVLFPAFPLPLPHLNAYIFTRPWLWVWPVRVVKRVSTLVLLLGPSWCNKAVSLLTDPYPNLHWPLLFTDRSLSLT